MTATMQTIDLTPYQGLGVEIPESVTVDADEALERSVAYLDAEHVGELWHYTDDDGERYALTAGELVELGAVLAQEIAGGYSLWCSRAGRPVSTIETLTITADELGREWGIGAAKDALDQATDDDLLSWSVEDLRPASVDPWYDYTPAQRLAEILISKDESDVLGSLDDVADRIPADAVERFCAAAEAAYEEMIGSAVVAACRAR